MKNLTLLILLSYLFSQASIDTTKKPPIFDLSKGLNIPGLIPSDIPVAEKIQLLGAGEILIQSIDKDGTLQGYDIELINLISKDLNIPTLACSGAGNWQHFLDCFMKTNVAGVCTTNIYHFTNSSVINAKRFLNKKQITVRMPKISNNLTI